mmetsp:Transcript_7581/g.12409  ORF Transcript_7581/g.12409 Transcript_7581/m.12409 type:complete len:162 (-) Transcript_7581:598-1083(-)
MEPGFSDAADNPDDDEMRRDVPTTDDDVEGAAAETSRYQEAGAPPVIRAGKVRREGILVGEGGGTATGGGRACAELSGDIVLRLLRDCEDARGYSYPFASSDLGRGERREPELGERWGPNRSCEAGNDRCGEHFGELIRDLSFRSVTAGGTRTWMSAFTFR